MARVVIKCNANGPNLITVDGTVFVLCVDVERLIVSHIVTGLTARLGLKQNLQK